jgi:hypothetical protein
MPYSWPIWPIFWPISSAQAQAPRQVVFQLRDGHLPDVGHDTLALLKGLGETNWEFYRFAGP